MRSRGTKKARQTAPPTISARLVADVTLDAQADGKILASVEGYSIGLGTFSAAAAARADALRKGLPIASFARGRRNVDKEIDQLVRRLARHGLLEYSLPSTPHGEDKVVIEPQMADYWPLPKPLDVTDVLALSRFAYLRRRGNEMVMESPRADALFKICDPKIAAALAVLAEPQQIKRWRREENFPGLELLALLVDCQIVFKIAPADDSGLRSSEGDNDLVLWDFHDLVFHARSTQGRHANPLGGTFPFMGAISSLPAVRPPWPGTKIKLENPLSSPSRARSPLAMLQQQRHSVREFDDQQPITLPELSQFLAGTARVLSRWNSRGLDDEGPEIEYANRPYPSAGSCYELELYLAVKQCEGLARGFYHYDAGTHALVAIGVDADQLDALLAGAEFAMGASAAPQILITIAARFGRVAWKYSSIAYGLILKDVGVLTQTLYLVATDLELGGCAVGSVNIDLFAKMTGIKFHVEGPVGQFALGREAKAEAS